MVPPAYPPFTAFELDHLAVLLLLGGAIVWATRHARRKPNSVRPFEKTLALALLALYPVELAYHLHFDTLSPDNRLPCHLCSVAALCGAAALWWRHQRIAELVWFWGLAGTMNGLITPNLATAFPSPAFFLFFTLHAGVVFTAFYLVAGLNLRPQPGAILRAFGWIQIYLLLAAIVDFFTGANYGFLRAKPDQASLLDLLGPWPWYLLGLEALALALFSLLYLPFIPRKYPLPAPPSAPP